MSAQKTITLTEFATRFGAPKHEIIYLCEKQVVIPVVDAEGRGSSRRFSEKNVFELLLALELRKFNISTNFITIILRLLEKFILAVEKEFKGDFFWQARRGDLALSLLIFNGHEINYRYWHRSFGSAPPKGGKVWPGIDLAALAEYFEREADRDAHHEPEVNRGRTIPLAAKFGVPTYLRLSRAYGPGEPFLTRLEISLSEIAKLAGIAEGSGSKSKRRSNSR